MARRSFECLYMILFYLVDTTDAHDKGELWVSGDIVLSLLASLPPQSARQRFRRQFKIPLDYAIKKKIWKAVYSSLMQKALYKAQPG